VLQYLARCTHRVAISNHRLVSFTEGKVTFRWRDSAHDNEQKLLTLPPIGDVPLSYSLVAGMLTRLYLVYLTPVADDPNPAFSHLIGERKLNSASMRAGFS
jgi:hypothetical protein